MPPLCSCGLLWSWHSPHKLQSPPHLCPLPRGPVLRVTGLEIQGHCLQGWPWPLLNPKLKAQTLLFVQNSGHDPESITANTHYKVSQSLSPRLATFEGLTSSSFQWVPGSLFLGCPLGQDFLLGAVSVGYEMQQRASLGETIKFICSISQCLSNTILDFLCLCSMKRGDSWVDNWEMCNHI